MSNNVHISADERQTSTFLGTDYQVLLRREHTDGLVGVVDVSIQPGAGAPLHTTPVRHCCGTGSKARSPSTPKMVARRWLQGMRCSCPRDARMPSRTCRIAPLGLCSSVSPGDSRSSCSSSPESCRPTSQTGRPPPT